ncbi:MAG: hypothetical protein A2586_00350 [Candidatus Harrisonbacteria bacterium RIFOXYD1_FULL_40_9]|uniref:S1 motif domain-containing protein n=1 Tax=Candidatus Harrisonbacteria bacterium RIFOXYD1_FULL_40_9 TaxID=1798412 RepID=A0A1G1ZZA8_9BACT|nr:MAG: hypothetical protein A2586_00350 [Candidatus Harrisonbacteria bacterium RIFOXYD1_FULL_40_9]
MASIKKIATLSQFAQLIKGEPALVQILKVGELISVTFLERTSREAYFEIGNIGTGIIFGTELLNARKLIEELKVGDSLTAKIVSLDNGHGYVELSISEAGKQKAWQVIKELQEKGEIITVKIGGANSGGLTTIINNIPAFLPVSQLSNENYPRVNDGDRAKILEELRKFVGRDLKAKIIDVDARKNKLIISEREISDQNVKELLGKYTAGQIIDGVISGVADFGAFIRFTDNPAIEGLIHVSEIDHKIVENPKEVLKIGEAVKVQILEIKEGRVFLSLKALKPNPWDKVADKYKVGAEIEGVVYKFNPFGAFINLDNEIQGLIHVSLFGGSIEEMKKKLTVGQKYTFIIELVKPTEKRLILKLK